MIELCLLGKEIINSRLSDQTDCAVFVSALLLFGTNIAPVFQVLTSIVASFQLHVSDDLFS